MLPPISTEEFADHTHDVLVYLSALSWTHAFLPTLGGPTLIGISELFHHKFRGPYLVFVWLYTIVITLFCFWCFRKLSAEAAALPANDLPHTIWRAILDTISKSMAWIAAWAWTVALLGFLPTNEPFEALFSAAAVTLAGASALLSGQQGRGPFAKALRRAAPEQLKWMIFFISWMVAIVWVGALTACVSALGFHDSLVPSWIVAAGTIAARWLWLWHGYPPRDDVAAVALGIYAASPDVGLTVGLVAPPLDATEARANNAQEGASQSGLRVLLEASLGLGALAGAWIGCVAVQAASSALWATSGWPISGISAVVADFGYAAALSYASVACVSKARHISATEAVVAGSPDSPLEETLARRARRSAGIVGETAALAVACGWAWYNALMALLPPLTSTSVIVRSFGAICVSTCAVCGMLTLKPRNVPDSTTTSSTSITPSTSTAAGDYRPPRVNYNM